MSTADTIWLKNGDRIKGSIEFKNNDRVMVNTDYASSIAIHWKDVVTLETEKPILIRLDNGGDDETGVLDIAEEGYVICKTCTRKMIPLTAIDTIIYPKPLVSDLRFEGNIEITSNFERKKDDTDEFKGDAELRMHHGKWRHLIAGEKKYKEENSDLKDNNWEANYKLDRFLTPQFYLRGTGEYDRDHIDKTRERSGGVGAGYLIQDDKLGRIDLTLAYERYHLEQTAEALQLSWQFSMLKFSWDIERRLAGNRISAYTKGDIGLPHDRGIDVRSTDGSELDLNINYGIHLYTDSESGLRYHFNSWSFATLKYEYEEYKMSAGNLRNYLYAVGVGAHW